VREYAGLFILVFLAVVAATFISGSIRAGKPHLGLPDQ
jgi:hypothetical protein